MKNDNSMKKTTITVFTPTYNRDYCLKNCYDSLKRQTSKDFCWLVIDDGSIDNTENLVKSWMKECNDFKIDYVYKENGGLHTAYNKAIEIIDTELCICIDSDDYMPNDAIEKIIKKWKKDGDKKYAGIIGLDYYTNGNIIGKKLPEKKDVNINELFIKGLLVGDKKLVIRTELYKMVAPMPTFNGEKNFNPNYMNIQIGEEFDFLVMNENLCFVEYQENGMTYNIFNQYINSPNSFAQIRRLYLSLENSTILFKIRHAIHYNSSCILSKKYKDIIAKSPNKYATFLTFPLGMILTLYIKLKASKIGNKKC